jgi:hypothetical protein
MSDNKQKIINDIYLDRAGFGSKQTTLKDAREKDSSIKMSDVEEFFRKKMLRSTQSKEGITVSQHHPIIILIRLICSLWGIMILMKNINSEEDL